MTTPKRRIISLAGLGMTQAELERLIAEGPKALSADQRLKMLADVSRPIESLSPRSVAISELRQRFFAWLDASLAEAPIKKVRAFNICLYEGADFFEADFFGCPTYVADEHDWACTWSHEGKGRFLFSSDEIEPEWEEGLRVAKKWLKEYLRADRSGAAIIKKVGVATVGFSDGDLHVVWPEKKKGPTRR